MKAESYTALFNRISKSISVEEYQRLSNILHTVMHDERINEILEISTHFGLRIKLDPNLQTLDKFGGFIPPYIDSLFCDGFFPPTTPMIRLNPAHDDVTLIQTLLHELYHFNQRYQSGLMYNFSNFESEILPSDYHTYVMVKEAAAEAFSYSALENLYNKGCIAELPKPLLYNAHKIGVSFSKNNPSPWNADHYIHVVCSLARNVPKLYSASVLDYRYVHLDHDCAWLDQTASDIRELKNDFLIKQVGKAATNSDIENLKFQIVRNTSPDVKKALRLMDDIIINRQPSLKRTFKRAALNIKLVQMGLHNPFVKKTLAL